MLTLSVCAVINSQIGQSAAFRSGYEPENTVCECGAACACNYNIVFIDCEVFNFDVLKEAYENSSEKYEKEHVTPYIYKTNPNKFEINEVISSKNNSDIRITLDTPQDYALLCVIYDNLYEQNNFFTLKDILDLFEHKPWIKYWI